jgi:2-oxoisovalerate dehydrogenase E1 component alpha subunit
MGMPMIDAIRQMASKATDPHSKSRNFINHFCVKEWNVVPGTSTIETQYSVAPGTALAQRRHGGDAITIVNGGDAGSAEADFATCLNWSSRPGRELPILILVMNNHWGISTHDSEVQGARTISKRAEAFGIEHAVVDGNDPIASWKTLERAIGYVRKERRPFCLEAFVSRLHGHSSSSGSTRVDDEPDCMTLFEQRLIEAGVHTAAEMKQIKDEYEAECLDALNQVREEPFPDPSTMYDHTFAT